MHQDRIALIERWRNGQHYFSFPGGGVDDGETPAEAAVREANEELGLKVAVERQVVSFTWKGNPHSYFLVTPLGGTFGTGKGEEYGQPGLGRGTYHPVWMPIADLLTQPVLPPQAAKFVQRAAREGWPAQVVDLGEV
jgi:8-oxo-dGTP pyrophosphatase MutT (NUDIX family)